ncbi:MAG: MoaD/ThiS family protein [Propionibacteriaceae bacterium]|jgi:molybdopterin converting factor small subunit|nr:MoaD/ThiS family protein [Propionibacteriaceae bacterium]
MATVFIPTALRAFTDRQSQVEITSDTVGEAISALAALYPDLAPHILDDEGALRGFVNVFIGQTNIRETQGLDTPVATTDEVSIVPAIAGGSDLARRV